MFRDPVFINPQIPRNGEIWTPDRPYNRAYTPTEIIDIIERNETAASLGGATQGEIPTYRFLNRNEVIDAQLLREVSNPIKSGVNKYHCCLTPVNNDQNQDPKGLEDIISVHAKMAMHNLKNSTPPHTLPVVFNYVVGFKGNHAVTVAFRVESFDDRSKNEIMVVNPLPGYHDWEQAAIKGLTAALDEKVTKKPDAPGDQQHPKVFVINPTTYPNARIQQEFIDDPVRGRGMASSCGGIAAEMGSAISANTSFANQQSQLVGHLANQCGRANEVQLRQQHTELLRQPRNEIHPITANMIVAELLLNPAKIQTTQGLEAFCKQVKDQKIIQYMLKSEPLKAALEQQTGNMQAFENLKQLQNDRSRVITTHRYESEPKTPMALADALVTKPYLISSALLQLKAAGLDMGQVLAKIPNDAEGNKRIKDFLKNPVLAASVSTEQKDQLLARVQTPAVRVAPSDPESPQPPTITRR